MNTSNMWYAMEEVCNNQSNMTNRQYINLRMSISIGISICESLFQVKQTNKTSVKVLTFYEL